MGRVPGPSDRSAHENFKFVMVCVLCLGIREREK